MKKLVADHILERLGAWNVSRIFGYPGEDHALASDRPTVIEAITDPEVPPLPPHITVEQAHSLMSALRKGDPNTAEVIRQSFTQKLIESRPGR
ncbi:MAG TPA: hypothetical protein VHV75_18615 [Solirubrobacteraceae bacterium]|jgi:thiamine pyrophosphate-dependent acetolactate synthase large subunit-like protein|nr:hypothetical protein [Solirubrobacteraceae bacterium]